MAVWVRGKTFREKGGQLIWTVLDFDHDTETVLGICENQQTRIFYFNEVECG